MNKSPVNRQNVRDVFEERERGYLDLSLVTSTQWALGLDKEIVGITFFSNERDYQKSPAVPPRRPLSHCMMVKLATMGRALKAKEEHVNCPGARRALGLTRPDTDFKSGSRYFSFRLYENMETARATTATVSLLSRDVLGLSVQPLAFHDKPPDVVLLICNAYQAMRIIQGYTYHFGPAPQFRCTGMQGVCSELTARSFEMRDIHVSLLCSGTRFSCAWKDAELGVAMPFDMFPKVFDGVIKTVNGAEPDRRKREIIGRSDPGSSGLDVEFGTAYYWRGASRHS